MSSRILDALISLRQVVLDTGAHFVWKGQPDRAADFSRHVSRHASLVIGEEMIRFANIMHGLGMDVFNLEIGVTQAEHRFILRMGDYCIVALWPNDPSLSDKAAALQVLEAAILKQMEQDPGGDVETFEVATLDPEDFTEENGGVHIYRTQICARSPRAAATLVAHLIAASRHYTQDEDILSCRALIRDVTKKYSPQEWTLLSLEQESA